MSVYIVLTIAVLISGFYMSWNIGANDVANAMGTSVGSGALTLFKAVIIASVFEFCGAFFLGESVSKTIQQGMMDPSLFENNSREFLYGMISSLIATALWLQVASYFGWPVSTTHAIVGALLGFGIFVNGYHSMNWNEIIKIVVSWVVSPALSGLFAYIIFTILQKNVLFAARPIIASKIWVTIFFGIVGFVFTISLLLNGIGSFHSRLNFLHVVLCGVIVFIIFFLTSKYFICRKKIAVSDSLPINASLQMGNLNKAMRHLKRFQLISKGVDREMALDIIKKLEKCSKSIGSRYSSPSEISDYKVVEKMFSYLQILSASYVAFSHGANDVANAIGPVSASLNVIFNGNGYMYSRISSYLLAFGGLGIIIGLATWGWRVMETIGRKITELTPTRGFSAEFGAAVTILVASKCGIPISTTHCIVGGVLGVGLARGISALNIRTLKDIVLSWVITIPSSAILCIIIFYIIKVLLQNHNLINLT